MPVVTRTMRKTCEGSPPDVMSLKATALVGETKETVLKIQDSNIPLMIPSQKLLAKANADIGKILSSPTKSPSRLPVAVLRDRGNGQPRKPLTGKATKLPVGKSKKGLRGPLRKVPETVWIQVMEHLLDDQETLQACTLVHSSWTSPARYHLFGSLQFGFQHDSIDDLLGALTTFAPSATHNIRALVLNFCEATRAPLLGITDLGRAAAHLPQLDDLVIAGVTLCAGRAPAPAAPHRVSRLVLDALTVDPRELQALLAAVAPRVGLCLGRNVRVRAKFWVPDANAGTRRALARVAFGHLQLGLHEGNRYGQVLAALRTTGMPRSLSRLDVDALWAPDVPDVQQVLADVSTTLKELSLNLRECSSTPESRLGLSSGFELGVLPKLKQVRLHFSNPHMSQDLLGHMVQELQCSAKKRGRKLAVVLHFDEKFIDQIGSWEAHFHKLDEFATLSLKINDDESLDDETPGRELTRAEWKTVREKIKSARMPQA